MVYTHFTITDPAATTLTVGEQLSEWLENDPFTLLSPMTTQWGYHFEVVIRRQVFEVAVRHLAYNDYGLEVKKSPDVVGVPTVRNSQEKLEELQDAVEDALAEIGLQPEVTWYSFAEWKAAFGKSFWDE